MTILGRLADEPPEPLDEAAIAATEARLRQLWMSPTTIERRDLEGLVAQIRWQQRRLQRVEEILVLLLEGLGLWR